jgi:hypothetical protein
MKKLLSLLLPVLYSFSVSATHFSGGELRYEFNGTKYNVELSLYHSCDPNSASLNINETITFQSASLSVNFIRQVQMSGKDTLGPSCSGINSCNTPFSPDPGYVVGKYRDTVTLPPATDWVISYMNGARITSLANVTGSSNNMYLEATLDNSVAQNSNAWIPNAPGYFALTNQTMTIPLQTLDAEGDGIVYDLITPLQSATLQVPYTAGYSAGSPLGGSGVYSINSTNQTLSLKAVTTGKFALAFRVKEYRNSVLVGSYIRDFTVFSLPGSSGITYPMATSLAPFTVYTCPGQSNSITVNFTDPTPTDSVVTIVSTPSIPGFSFSSSVTNGIGAGSANVNWTTPLTMNPATLPFFYIKLKVRDNACPRSMVDYAIIARTKQCGPDSVWPGDANGDYTVNVYDPLAVAVALGQTGTARTSPTTSWVAQACPMWANAFVFNNVNMKHADCDGNGTIATADLAAITANYGLTHPKEGGDHKQTAGPTLYFDFTGVTLEPGTTVNIPIKLGDASNTISGFYGIATRIGISNAGSITTPPTIATTNSWLGNSSNTINFNKNTAPNSIDWAHARTDHQNQTGQGIVGTLTFAVPANAVRGTFINFAFNNTKLIDKDGNDITAFNTEDGSFQVPFPQSVYELPKGLSSLNVMPNPSGNMATLQLMLDKTTDVQLRVVDMLGKTVWQQTTALQAGNNNLALPAQQVATGMYTIHIQADGWNSIPVVKWVKQ